MKWLLLFYIFISTNAYAFTIGTKAKQAVVFDSSSNTILFSKNANNPMFPSSMTKIMTLYVAFGYLKAGIIGLNDKFLVGHDAWKRGGSSMFLKNKQEVKVSDLINGISVISGNDASITLSEGIAGSQESFVEEMNNTAKKIGMIGTHFFNVTGWPNKNHFTTMNDMIKLANKLIYDYPEYYSLFSQRKFKFNNIEQKNNNKLLSKENGIDGIKTGHTDAGGYGIILSAKRNKRRIIVGVNGLKSDAERSSESRKLLLYALNNFDSKKIIKKGDKIGQIDILNGKKTSIPLISDSDVTISFERNNHKNVSVKLLYESFIVAPIKIKQKIAEIKISAPPIEDRIINVYATEDVEEISKVKKFFKKIFWFLN